MAPIIRQTWEQMRDEVLRRMGKLNVPSWESRMERFLTAAYYDIALTFHHYPLEGQVVMGVFGNTEETTWRFQSDVNYPNGAIYSLLSIRLRDGNGQVFQTTQENVKFIWQERREKGRPERWARRDDRTILWDREADVDYLADVYYYGYPRPPDFEVASPSELDELWDEHIMQRAMFLAAPATWRYDMSQVQVQTLQEFLQAQPQAPTKGQLVARAEVPLTSSNTGGSQ